MLMLTRYLIRYSCSLKLNTDIPHKWIVKANGTMIKRYLDAHVYWAEMKRWPACPSTEELTRKYVVESCQLQ